MPWCPNCKTEYREGIAKCADCGADLVEALEEKGEVPVLFGEEQGQMERFLGFLEYNGIRSGRVSFDEERGMEAVFVDRDQEERGLKLAAVFMAGEAQREKAGAEPVDHGKFPDSEESPEDEELSGDTEPSEEGKLTETEALELMYEKRERAVPYERKEEKAKNFISSAYVLLPMGILGLIAMALCFMGVIDLPLGGQTKYMTYGVLSFLFAVFVVTGVSAYVSGKKFQRSAEEENDLENGIHGWFTENCPRDMLDEAVPSGDAEEEVLYFRRCEWMRERLQPQYPEAEEGLLDAVIDAVYQEYYGE